MRVLIAGCGWLGTALGSALAERGDTVWGLRRNAALLPPALRPLEADLGVAGDLAALPAALDAVVYAAAPAAGDEPSYRRTYVEGLANLLVSLREHGQSGSAIPRVILLSSTSVYGQTAGEWVDESSPTQPADFRGRIVLEGEEALRASGTPSIALRLGGLYGPGRDSLIDAVRAGRAGFDPGPPRFTNRIHRDDAVGAIVHLLALPEPDMAPIYLGVDQEPADRNQVMRWLAQRLQVELRPETLPSSERALRRDTSKRCSSARLRASGYRFRYPSYREGYEALLGS